MAFLWRDEGGQLIVVFGSPIPSSRKYKTTKKNVVKVGPPMTNLSGSAHIYVPTNQSYLQYRLGIIRAISPFDSNVYHSHSLQAPTPSITGTEFLTSLYLTPYSRKKRRRRKERRQTQHSRSKHTFVKITHHSFLNAVIVKGKFA